MIPFRPNGWPTVIPRIVVEDVSGLVAFVRAVFDATGELDPGRPAEMRIGESIVIISDGGEQREAMRAFLYVYVADVDEVYRRAVAAGAQAIEMPADMPWGDRRATLRDAWMNLWQIATHRPGGGAVDQSQSRGKLP